MSVKALKELPGIKEEHMPQLAEMGIKSVADMKKALSDEAKVKEMVKALSGVGPKTVDKWKADLEGIDAEKEVKEQPVAKPVITETDEYEVKAKPELSDETEDALAKRALINGKRPAFKRQEWFRYPKLGEKWRRPKGLHSKMKRNLKRRPPVVDIGFRGPALARGLHPSGFEEKLVFTVDELNGVDPKTQAVRIGASVGTKKRIQIEDKAFELGIRVLNRMV
ncbi:MAG: 50S ribosomal protein L32e [Methanomassiliicoccaceae archaeon]|nr:50S ribosomal protein L32e [Methanomassiliicoccaceae archaeon]